MSADDRKTFSSTQSEQTEREARLQAKLDADRDRLLADRLRSFAPGTRQVELKAVQSLIEHQLQAAEGGYVIITGEAGQGKTSLIAQLIHQSYSDAAYHFIPFNPGLEHQVTLLRSLMAALALKYPFLSDMWTEITSRTSLAATFSAMLGQLVEHSEKAVIFIDGLDQIKPDAGMPQRDLEFLPLEVPAGIVLVVGSRPDDTLQPLRVRSPQKPYRLPALTLKDFRLVLLHRGVALSDSQLEALHHAVGGNAFDLDFAAQELYRLPTAQLAELLDHIRTNPHNALFDQALNRLHKDKIEWEFTLKPLLGYLLAAVKTEALSTAQLTDITRLSQATVEEGLERLGSLLGTADREGIPTYYLYHLKLIDYLQGSASHKEQAVFKPAELQEVHQRLAEWCEQDGEALWQDSQDLVAQARREYGRPHYITHLYYANNWEKLSAVLDAGEYGLNKIKLFDPSTQAYALDLQLGQQLAADPNLSYAEGLARLGHLWYYSLVKGSLVSRVDSYPTTFFEALYWLGRKREALAQVELLSDLNRQAKVLTRLAKVAKEQGAEKAEIERLSFQAYNIVEQLTLDQLQFSTWKALLEISDLYSVRLRDQISRIVVAASPNKTHKATNLSELAYQLAKIGQTVQAKDLFKQAIAIAETMYESDEQDEDGRSEVLQKIATQLAELGFFEEALATAHAITNGNIPRGSTPVKQEQFTAFSKIGYHMAQAGQLDQALIVFNQVVVMAQTIRDEEESWGSRFRSNIPDRTLDKIATQMSQAGLFKEAFEIAHKISDQLQFADTLGEIAFQLALAGHADQASSTFEEALAIMLNNEEAEDPRYRLLSDIAIKMARANLIDQSLAVIQILRASELKIISLSEVAFQLSKNHQLLKVQELLDQALRHIDVIFDVTDDDIDLHNQSRFLQMLIKPMIKADFLDQALVAATRIPVEQERAKSLSKIAIWLVQTNQFAKAETVLNQAFETARSINFYDGLSSVLKTIATELAKKGSFDQALAIVQIVPDVETQAGTLNAIASEQVQAGLLPEASATFQLAIKAAQAIPYISEDKDRRSTVLQLIVANLTQAGLFDQALAAVEFIPEKNERLGLVSNIALQLVQAGQAKQGETVFEQAYTIAQTLDESVTKAYILRNLASEMIELEFSKRGFIILSQVLDMIPNFANINDQVRSLIELATTLNSFGQSHRADDLFTRAIALIEPLVVKYDLLIYTANHLILANQLEQASAVYHQALVNAKTNASDTDWRHISRDIIKKLVEAKLFEQAFVTIQNFVEEREQNGFLQDIVKHQLKADLLDQALATAQYITNQQNPYQDDALSDIANWLAQKQQWEQAFAITHTISDKWYQDRVLSNISNQQLLAGLVDQALLTAQDIRDEYLLAATLAKAAGALAQAGKLDQAEIIFDRAIALAHTITNPDTPVYAFCDIIEALVQAGQTRRAEAIFEQAFTAAHLISDIKFLDDILRHLGRTLIKVQLFDQALTVAFHYTSDYSHLSDLNRIIKPLFQVSDNLNLAKLLQIVQRIWLASSNRSRLIELLPITVSFMHKDPIFLSQVLASFDRVAQFLKQF